MMGDGRARGRMLRKLAQSAADRRCADLALRDAVVSAAAAGLISVEEAAAAAGVSRATAYRWVRTAATIDRVNNV